MVMYILKDRKIDYKVLSFEFTSFLFNGIGQTTSISHRY